jgi:hypothetical protein
MSGVISASRSLSHAFVSDFLFQVCSVHSIGYNFHSTFCLRFRLEINNFSKLIFLLEVSRELPQCSTLNTFFHCSQFFSCSLHILTLFALTFLCVCRLANAASLGNGFARRPSLLNPLGLPPTRRRQIQWLFDLGGKKVGNDIFY